MLPRLLIVCLLAFPCCLSAASAATPKPLWSFGPDERWRGTGKGSEQLVQPGPQGLQITLPAAAKRQQVEFTAPRLAEGDYLQALEQITLEVVAGAAAADAVIGINFVDEDGEGFTAQPLPLKAGANQLTWELPRQFVHSWGMYGRDDAKNGKVDGRLRLIGVYLRRDRGGEPAVVTFRGASARFAARGAVPAGDTERLYHKPVWFFGGDGQHWQPESHKGAEPTIEATPDGLRIVLPPSSKPAEVAVHEKVLAESGFLSHVQGLVIEAAVSGASEAELGANLADGGNEGFTLMPRLLTPGENNITWVIPAQFVHSWGLWGIERNKNGVVDHNLRPLNVFVKRAPADETTVITLRRGSVLVPLAHEVFQGLSTGDPLRFLHPGREGELALHFHNPGTHPVELELDGAVESWDGSRSPVRLRQTVAPGQRHVEPLQASVLSGTQGIKWLDATLTVNGEPIPLGRQSFVYAEPAGPSPRPQHVGDGLWFGLHQDFNRWFDPVDELGPKIAAACGANVIRATLSWDRMEKTDDEYDWTLYERAWRLADENGMDLMASLWGTPRWASVHDEKPKQAKFWSKTAPRPEPFADYCRDAADHFRGRIRLWELVNEPDWGNFGYTGSTEDLIAAQIAAYDAVKQAVPEAIVTTPGFAKGSGKVPDLQARLLKQAAGHYDLHNIHIHGPFPEFKAEIEGEVARLRDPLNNPPPFWFGETSDPARGGLRTSEREQAATLVKKLSYAWSQGAVGYVWFRIWDDNDWDRATTWQDMHWGLFTSFGPKGQPKAVFAAHNALAKLIRGKQFEAALDLGPGRFGYVLSGAGERIVIAWTEDATLGDAAMVLEAPGTRSAESVDLMGNRRPAPQTGQRVVMAVRGEPSYLVLAEATAVEALSPALLKLESPVIATPGVPTTAQLAIANLTGAATTLQLTVSGDVQSEPLAPVQLQPGERQQVAARLTVPSAAATGKTLGARVQYVWSPSGLSGTLSLPITLGRTIPAAPVDQRPPDLVLASGDDVVNENTFMIGDDVEKLKWQGPRDLSARVWLGRQGDMLRVRLAVSDDKHVPQTQDSKQMTAGDSVRLILQDPRAAQRGWWELGLAMRDDGQPVTTLWNHDFYGSAKANQDVQLTVERAEGGLVYDAQLPLASFRLDAASLSNGLRFNVQVNDNDGTVREGWLQLAPGIEGDGVKDAAAFPIVRFE